MWFIGVEVEQETSASPPKKNPGSAPVPFLLAQEEVEVLNVSWQDKLINKELYGNLPPVSSKVGFRRLKLASHCARHPEEEAS